MLILTKVSFHDLLLNTLSDTQTIQILPFFQWPLQIPLITVVLELNQSTPISFLSQVLQRCEESTISSNLSAPHAHQQHVILSLVQQTIDSSFPLFEALNKIHRSKQETTSELFFSS